MRFAWAVGPCKGQYGRGAHRVGLGAVSQLFSGATAELGEDGRRVNLNLREREGEGGGDEPCRMKPLRAGQKATMEARCPVQ